LALALLCGCQPFEERQADLMLETGGCGGRVLAIDADSCLMGVGTRDGSVRVWGLEHGARHAAWRAHRGTVNGILFLPGDRLLTVGYDGQLALWSTVGRRIGGWSVRMQAWDEVARRGAGIGVVPVMGHFGTSGMTPPKADDSGRQRSRWAIDLSAALAALLKAPAGPAGPRGWSSEAHGHARRAALQVVHRHAAPPIRGAGAARSAAGASGPDATDVTIAREHSGRAGDMGRSSAPCFLGVLVDAVAAWRPGLSA
jgi:hypothetical protein